MSEKAVVIITGQIWVVGSMLSDEMFQSTVMLLMGLGCLWVGAYKETATVEE